MKATGWREGEVVCVCGVGGGVGGGVNYFLWNKVLALSPYTTRYFTFEYVTSVSKSARGSREMYFRAHQAEQI